MTDAYARDYPTGALGALPAAREAALREERNGALSSTTLAELAAAGLFESATFAHCGVVDPSATFHLLCNLGAANPAAAWVVGTSLLARMNATTSFGDGALDRFAAPESQVGGSARPFGSADRHGDDYVLSGRWPTVSGGETAAALVLGARASGSEQPHVVIVRREEYDIDLDWDVIGMRATGSHSVVIENLRLPAARLRPMRLTPQFPVLGAVTVLAPVLGATRAALSATVDLIRSGRRPTGLAASALADSPAARTMLARAAEGLEDAERLASDALHRSADEPLAARRRLAQSAAAARSAFEPMLDLHGVSAFTQDSLIGLLWRDVAVGSRHALTTAYAFEDAEVDRLLIDG